MLLVLAVALFLLQATAAKIAVPDRGGANGARSHYLKRRERFIFHHGGFLHKFIQAKLHKIHNIKRNKFNKFGAIKHHKLQKFGGIKHRKFGKFGGGFGGKDDGLGLGDDEFGDDDEFAGGFPVEGINDDLAFGVGGGAGGFPIGGGVGKGFGLQGIQGAPGAPGALGAYRAYGAPGEPGTPGIGGAGGAGGAGGSVTVVHQHHR